MTKPLPHRVPDAPGRWSRRRLLGASAASAATVCIPAALGLGAAPARAQAAFPSRPVKLVVPYSVGIGPDVVSRSVAQVLQQSWGQPVVVENRPGASGIVAFGGVRRTEPDGHTLYLADAATLAVNPLLHEQLPYDPQADLVPLTLLFQATFMLITGTGAQGRFPTLQAMLDTARRQPGEVRYAALGNGHPSHLAVETLARAAGVRMEPVHFKDGGTLFAAVAAGQVDFSAFSMHTVAPMVAAGKLRALAVGAAQRVAAHPEVPTIAEAGGPPVTMHPWAALVTVAGTPEPVLGRLRHDLAAALASPPVRQTAEKAGFELLSSPPQAVVERARADRALYEPLVREGRVTAQS